MLSQAIEFVDKSFKNKSKPHFERALYYVKVLKPDADQILLIAAYAHDIERAYKNKEANTKRFASGESLKRHELDGGRIMYNFLLSKGTDKGFAKSVQELIAKHEEGGTDDQNILKDADSISYFENNALKHCEWIKTKGFSKEEIRRKFDWMYERITLAKAKKIAEPMYKKAKRKLEAM